MSETRVAVAEGPALVLAGYDDEPLTSLAAYRAGRRLRAAREGAGPGSSGRDPGDHRVEPARPRRRLLPHGAQGKLHPDPGQDREADLHHGQRRRVRAGDVQGPRDHAQGSAPPDRGLPRRRVRDPVEACLHLRPRRVLAGVRGAQAALDEAREANLLGGAEIVIHRGAGAYICGEETGLLESLEGKRGQPRSKPPFPAIQGLYDAPTLINNVESITNDPGDPRRRPRRLRADRRPA